MRNSFKNFRKDKNKNSENGPSKRKAPATREPPSKRMKCTPSEDDDLDDEEFEEFVGDLAEEWRKDKKGIWQLSTACLTKPLTGEGSGSLMTGHFFQKYMMHFRAIHHPDW